MGTIIEGEWAPIMDLVRRCFLTLEPDCERIHVSIRIDYRRAGSGRLKSKVEKIETLLGRSVKK
jgi:uncharacterized protein YqgV (UPF0045/DUF77 family)